MGFGAKGNKLIKRRDRKWVREFPYHSFMKSYFLLLACLGLFFSSAAQPAEFAGSFESMKSTAISQGKPFAVYFYTSSLCSPCQSLEQNTLRANTIREILDEDFLFMKLDAESLVRQGFQLAAKYRVTLYPTILLFDKSGNLSKPLTGMQTPSMLLPELRALAPATVVVAPSPVPTRAPRPAPPATRARSSQHSGWWAIDISPLPSQGYGVQVGVYARYETILEEIDRLKPHYDYPMAIRAELFEGQTVFKLIFGPFPNQNAARQFERKFERSEGDGAVLVELGS